MTWIKNKSLDAETFDDTMPGVILKETERCIRLWPKMILFMMLCLMLLFPKQHLIERYGQAWIGADILFIAMLGFVYSAIEEFWRNRKSTTRNKFKYRLFGELIGTVISAIIYCCCTGWIGQLNATSLLLLVPFGVVYAVLMVVKDACRIKWEKVQERFEDLEFDGRIGNTASYHYFYNSVDGGFVIIEVPHNDSSPCHTQPYHHINCRLSHPSDIELNTEALISIGFSASDAKKYANELSHKYRNGDFQDNVPRCAVCKRKYQIFNPVEIQPTQIVTFKLWYTSIEYDLVYIRMNETPVCPAMLAIPERCFVSRMSLPNEISANHDLLIDAGLDHEFACEIARTIKKICGGN